MHPYHLIQSNNRWYLLAPNAPASKAGPKCGEGGEAPNTATDTATIRKFVLGRMQKAVMLEDTFSGPIDFDPKSFFARSMGVMTGPGDYEVVIELDAWLTDVLRGRRWHPTQVWSELPGGGSHLTMRLSCLEEIEQLVLSWGTRATVIQPVELRERLAATTGVLAKRYEKT